MICPECGLEFKQNKRPVDCCPQCRHAKSQVKYVNKTKGKNLKYVSAIDTYKTSKSKWEFIMTRRLKSYNKTYPEYTTTLKELEARIEGMLNPKKQVTTKENNTSISTSSKVDNLKDTYYSKVQKDIDEALAKANLSLNTKDIDSIPSWFSVLYTLVNTDAIINIKNIEYIYNGLFQTYKHTQETLEWADLDKVNEVSYAIKALSELRRPIKNIMDFYFVIAPIIEHIKADSTLIELINEAKDRMDEKVQYHQSPVFFAEVGSNFIEEDSIVPLEQMQPKTRLFDCTVPCYYLSGNPNRQLFRLNNGLRAKNEVEARYNFIAFLRSKFSSLVYDEDDISIVEVESPEEILRRAKECL